jgi:hypothetical protein
LIYIFEVIINNLIKMMTVQTFFKGLFMVLISIGVTFFSQTPIQWALLGVTAIAVIIGYVGKNLIFVASSDPTSGPNEFTWLNTVSALLVLISTTIMEGAAMLIVDGKIAWLILGKVVLSVVFSYVATTFFSAPKSQSKLLVS